MSDLLRLRPYQRECLDRIYDAHANGMRKPAVVLPTGSGKTVIFSHLSTEHIAAYGTRVLILVHRDELCDQALDKLRQLAPHLNVGKVKAQDDEVNSQVVVASVQTLARANRRARLVASQQAFLNDPGEFPGRMEFGLIVTDECFPAGTLVGGVPIEELKAGDLVPSWNESTGRQEYQPVVASMSRRPEALVRVSMADGSAIVCTPNHPVLTPMGWCNAGGLWRGAEVVSFTHDENADLHRVSDEVPGVPERETGPLETIRSGVLQGRLSGCVGIQEQFRTDGQDEPGTRVRTDAEEQPHAPTGEPGEDAPDAGGDRAQAASARGQRNGSDSSAEEAGGVPGVAHGSGDRTGGRGTPVPLPGGHRAPRDEGSHRSGRGVPLLTGPPSLRPQEGGAVVLTRVDRVEVLEPGLDGTYGGLCRDGLVYNIEVDTTHTYLIDNGTVVHNCHHGAAQSYQAVYADFPEADQVGFTATLVRGDGVGLGDTWDDVVYTRSVLWMIAENHLVDVRGVAVDIDALNLGAVKKTAGDFQAKALGDAMQEAGAPGFITQAMEKYAADRRSVVFTPTVAMAHAVAAELAGRGTTCGVVDGTTPRDVRRAIYDDFRTGKIQTLVNCMVLTEGFDAPYADCAVIARPTQSPGLYVQMVGRVLRPWPGKKDALVLDMTGIGGKLSTLIDLAPGEVQSIRQGESLAEAAVRTEEESNKRVSAGSLTFALRHRDMDLFAASSQAWLRTGQGVMFIALKDSFVFLWPGTEGTWDVCWAGKKGSWVRLHESLPLGTAMAWAETEADNRHAGGEFDVAYGITRDSSWRKTLASDGQRTFARMHRVDIPEGARKGEASDLISVALASKKFDRYVGKV